MRLKPSQLKKVVTAKLRNKARAFKKKVKIWKAGS